MIGVFCLSETCSDKIILKLKVCKLGFIKEESFNSKKGNPTLKER